MTKEEIIEECKQRLGFETDYEMYSLCQHEKDFYNAIIKELEQQPSEDWYDIPSEEMTLEQARQAVKDLRKKLTEYLEQESSDDCERVLNRVMEYTYGMLTTEKVGLQHLIKSMIDELPPATPIRKKGEWRKQNDDYFDWYECSECGYGSEGEMQYSGEHDIRTNFCPNCGAEMRGVENENIN